MHAERAVATDTTTGAIRLVGARTNNLKGIDVEIPLGQFVAISGVSGSGKSSLAFDTLYVEGQRRYIETFPASARQFLPRWERPPVEYVESVPPAIAVGQHAGALGGAGGRTSLAAATGLRESLAVLLAALGETICPRCGGVVTSWTPERLLEHLRSSADGQAVTLGFPPPASPTEDDPAPADVWSPSPREFADWLGEAGFRRLAIGGHLFRVDAKDLPTDLGERPLVGVVDRLRVGESADSRFVEALDTAFLHGAGQASVLVGETWQLYSARRECCGIAFPEPRPHLFRRDHPAAACPACDGTGTQRELDFGRVVPDPDKTLLQRAVAPFGDKQAEAELRALLQAAKARDLPANASVGKLTERQRTLLWEGDADWPGVRGMLLARAQGKSPAAAQRVLEPWQSSRPCDVCGGTGFTDVLRAHRLGGKNYPGLLATSVTQTADWLAGLASGLASGSALAGSLQPAWRAAQSRLHYLQQVGLGYLTLDRPASTLSVGEARRVALTAALGSGLARTLFVLDEPTAGLHPADAARLVDAIRLLLAEGNTVVVVEHDPAVLRQADWLLDLGPGAGKRGGRLLYAGPPAGIAECQESVTAGYLGPRSVALTDGFHPRGTLQIHGARTHNLQGIDVGIPLGGLVAVTGVSGAGKSSLVTDTLVPGLQRLLGDTGAAPGPFDRIWGYAQLDDVVCVDAGAVGRTARGNPATYLKFFDEIRASFAETLEARTRGLQAADFGFNRGAGRCDTCEGIGSLAVDMQFLADVRMTCPDCHGTRYKASLLEVKYRGRSISEVLELSVDAAFGFFREQHKVLTKLTSLRQVGLGYLKLGQPLATLSGGEAARLKLASYLDGRSGKRVLFVCEEPTTGLHPADLETIVTCLRTLVDVGHTVLVVDHDPYLLADCDHVIELGPGAGPDGGRVIAEGSPYALAGLDTPTGRALASIAG